MHRRIGRAGLGFLLAALFLGFAASADGEDSLEKLQKMDIADLLNIKVVTASKSPESAFDAPSVISVLTREEIEDINPANLSELLNTIPGFNIQTRNLGEALFQVRGINSVHDTILLMIDGHPVNDRLFQTITYIVNSIPVAEIERIEVIRGPGSSIYGANAFYAVINVITLRGQPNTFIRASGAYASEGTSQAFALARQETEKSHFLAAGGVVSSDGIQAPFTDRAGVLGLTFFPQEREHVYANVGKDWFSLSALYNRETLGPYVGIAYCLNDRTNRKYTTSALEGRVEIPLGKGWTLSGKIYGDSFVYDCFWEYKPPSLQPPNGTLTQAYARDYRVGSEWNLNVDFSPKHRLLAGFSFDRIGLTGSRASDNSQNPYEFTPIPGSWISNATENNTAAYFQDNYFITDGIQLVLGLRIDHHSYYGSSVNPRCALTGSAGRNGHFKLIYAQAFHAPSFWDLFGNSPDQVWNPKLKPEKLRTVEGEFTYKIGHSLLARVNYFHNEIRDLIARATIFVGNVEKGIKINLGKVRVDGLETELDGNFREGKTWFKLSAFWARPRDVLLQEDTPWAPKFGTDLVLSHDWIPGLNSTLLVKYVGKVRRETGDPRPPLPGTTTLDLSTHYTFSLGTLRFAAQNLLDAAIVSPSPKGKLGQDYPLHGRVFRLTLEFNLK